MSLAQSGQWGHIHSGIEETVAMNDSCKEFLRVCMTTPSSGPMLTNMYNLELKHHT